MGWEMDAVAEAFICQLIAGVRFDTLRPRVVYVATGSLTGEFMGSAQDPVLIDLSR